MYISDIDLKQTGQNIRILRKRAGLTVRDLQEACGFSNPQAVYKWQRGESLPSVDSLVILSCLFQVPIDRILACDPHPLEDAAVS